MRNSKTRLRRILGYTTAFILWTFLFAIAYSQSPLFTSNQNQYFLHGLARAGYGYLNQDWLANTLDPTPIFSELVTLTYRYFDTSYIYYIYYSLLMGIYFFSLYGIGAKVVNIGVSRNSPLLFLALLITVHSAGLRFALSRLVGVNWAYILEDGLADQRMLGPVFQPSAFGVLLLLSIYLFLDRKALLAGFFAAMAAIIHPTYLIGSAVLTSTYMLITYRENHQIKQSLMIGLSALIPILPLLMYLWGAFGGSPSDVTVQARQILVDYRIPHHALVSQWFDATAIIKIVLVALCLYLVRSQRIFLILLTSFLVAALSTLVQVLTKSNNLALLFPWRISIYLVPLSTSLLIAYIVSRLMVLPRLQSAGWQSAIGIISAFLILSSVLVGVVRFTLDIQRKMQEAERGMQAYINMHKTQQDIYLTPVKMQDFRLFTGAPVYVDFKSIPYKDSDVIEWYRRVKLVDQFYETHDCKILESLVNDEGVTHAVLARDNSPLECPQIEETYRDEDYIVYKLPPAR